MTVLKGKNLLILGDKKAKLVGFKSVKKIWNLFHFSCFHTSCKFLSETLNCKRFSLFYSLKSLFIFWHLPSFSTSLVCKSSLVEFVWLVCLLSLCIFSLWKIVSRESWWEGAMCRRNLLLDSWHTGLEFFTTANQRIKRRKRKNF